MQLFGKKILFPSLLLGLLILLVGCSTGESTSDTTESDTADGTEEAAPATSPEAAPAEFTTTVVEDGIASPRKEMKGTMGDVQVTLNYGSPSVNEREIWGGLVPFDQVWRTGANAATTIEFSADVVVEGQPLAAGKYGLFTIPSADEVVVIFNKNGDQWGANDYDEAQDALRVTVSPVPVEASTEALEFTIAGDAVVLHWEKWTIPFKVAAG